jgi:hypothetical protein
MTPDDKDIDLEPSEWNSERHPRNQDMAWDAIGGAIILAAILLFTALFGRLL